MMKHLFIQTVMLVFCSMLSAQTPQVLYNTPTLLLKWRPTGVISNSADISAEIFINKKQRPRKLKSLNITAEYQSSKQINRSTIRFYEPDPDSFAYSSLHQASLRQLRMRSWGVMAEFRYYLDSKDLIEFSGRPSFYMGVFARYAEMRFDAEAFQADNTLTIGIDYLNRISRAGGIVLGSQMRLFHSERLLLDWTVLRLGVAVRTVDARFTPIQPASFVQDGNDYAHQLGVIYQRHYRQYARIPLRDFRGTGEILSRHTYCTLFMLPSLSLTVLLCKRQTI